MKISFTIMLIFTFFFGFSQQVLKKITDTSTKTIIELYTIRNGTNAENVVGNDNFTTFNGISHSTFRFNNENGSITYDWYPPFPPEFSSPPPTNETICNGNFQLITGHGGYFNRFQSSNGEILPIRVMELWYGLDALQDNNSLNDVFNHRCDIPKTLTTGQNIPINTWFICQSLIGIDNNITVESKTIGFKFNGLTWIEQTQDWAGNNFDIVNDVCTNLGISELENKSFDINIIPIPAFESITIQNSQNLIGKFTYKIYDITGRIIKYDKSAYNQEIRIDELTHGNYLLQIIDESTRILTKRIIKE